MKFGRYKDTDWNSVYKSSRPRLSVFLKGEGCSFAVASEAQLMLKAYYGGPWKMIAQVTKRELQSLWDVYGWPKWNWIRVKVFRRKQDKLIAEYEATALEIEAAEKLLGEIFDEL